MNPPHHLYVHIPFCNRLCPYCDFVKRPAALGGFDRFVEALLAEAAQRASSLRPATAFFGGGTPSTLSIAQLERLLRGLDDICGLRAAQEITLEINPGTLSPAKARKLRELGVTRASVGIQSWHARHLATLGRSHSPEAGRRCLEILRQAGFDNISMDLIFAIPGQTLEDWQKDLEQSLRCAPQHISAYCLTYEEGTEFGRRRALGLLAPDDAAEAAQFELAQQMLEAGGFVQYEVSNYARPGYECRHNLAIWQGADYLGLGPGAVSTVGTRRLTNTGDFDAYCRAALEGRSAAATEETLTPPQLALERLALGLRTRMGVPASWIAIPSADRLIHEGLARWKADRLALTARGFALADEIAAALEPSSIAAAAAAPVT